MKLIRPKKTASKGGFFGSSNFVYIFNTTDAMYLCSRACFIDPEIATVKISTIQALHSCVGLIVWHFDKGKTPRSSGFSVCNEIYRLHFTVLAEKVMDVVLCGLKW
jgi:hypothetical protein